MNKRIIRSTNIPSDVLLDMHWKQEMSMAEIGKFFGYKNPKKNTGIHQIFKKRGLPHRTNKEAVLLRRKKSPEDWFKNKPKGEKHFKWKGGRLKSSGYIRIQMPEHPRANSFGYVLEHIVIWGQTHGKSLPKGWIIHHINGIRHDNRPENLLAVPRGKHEHHTFVKILQARIRELEQLHLKF